MSIPAQKSSEKKIEESKTERIIVTFKGSKYDVTDFVVQHPGGKKVLLRNNGKDIEQLMLDNKHSVFAYETLAKYKIQ